MFVGGCLIYIKPILIFDVVKFDTRSPQIYAEREREGARFRTSSSLGEAHDVNDDDATTTTLVLDYMRSFAAVGETKRSEKKLLNNNQLYILCERKLGEG